METKKVVCSKCGEEVHPCPARWDDEPTSVGWYPCSKHPNAAVRMETLNKRGNKV